MACAYIMDNTISCGLVSPGGYGKLARARGYSLKYPQQKKDLLSSLLLHKKMSDIGGVAHREILRVFVKQGEIGEIGAERYSE